MAKARTPVVAGDNELSEGQQREIEQEAAGAKAGKRNRPKRFQEVNAKGGRKTDERRRGGAHESRTQAAARTSRAQEQEDEPWVPPASLPHVPARPGFVQRWIRVANGSDADPTNVSRKFREGWQPRRADTVPNGIAVPKINRGEYAGCIGVEGSVLCEMPKARNDRRNAHFRSRQQRQRASIQEQLKSASQGSGTSFGPIHMVDQPRVLDQTRLRKEVAVAGDE